MGVVVKEIEIASPVPPAKLFKAFVLDSDKLFPKVLPQGFKSIELLEGDGGPGSIKKITVEFGKRRTRKQQPECVKRLGDPGGMGVAGGVAELSSVGFIRVGGQRHGRPCGLPDPAPLVNGLHMLGQALSWAVMDRARRGKWAHSRCPSITFTEAEQVKYAKQRVEFVDKEKLVYHHSWIEGDVLMNMFEKITDEIKLEAGHGGSSVCKITTKFFIIGEAQLSDELLKGGKEKVVGLFKAVEAYVLANP